ncbi:MAG TPA: sugar phosphate isomerase/epimerase [Clostridiales bacterium]|jgi:sugar phosphate isomerase/epimerase|nr:sugar phosphate isomerase/epimerase [Clostridiales bacterium]HOJ35233.1 sugar phosphate isomerase/epimerase [Clostridiales bacterium]HOL78414.1 sugar phosphate isomerase/epimerase [Clostridiales bacterium]HPP68404.1 sugar phosphate isomerase/epimerase [Clostridiales bacterium]HPU67759.1 sugar phosphate isomerase/epimerase [Clostridiales bacterium]
MKLGVFTTLLSNLSLEEALKYFTSLGIEMVEIGTGGYPGNAHANPDVLLNDEAEFKKFMDTIKKYNVEISAFSCHGNPVHPDKETAKYYDEVIRKTILLCEKVGIHQINTFSGCPGDHPGAKYPNWVTCPWPNDYLEILDYQWNEVLIPYWKDLVAFAKEHGVNKIALELHPGFAVYNTDSLLKLREAVGPEIGANLDPSHLIWQGMEPVAVIRKLGDAIFHFHAKDTKIDKYNTAVTGVLDTKGYGDVLNRSWTFRSVGYGNDLVYWKDIISNLRLVGYDYAISIEHEDALMSQNEGLSKAVATLKEAIMTETPGEMWWV